MNHEYLAELMDQFKNYWKNERNLVKIIELFHQDNVSVQPYVVAMEKFNETQ